MDEASREKLNELVDHLVEVDDSRLLVGSDHTVAVKLSAVAAELDLELFGSDDVADSVAGPSGECEEDIPYADMWLRRTPDGVLMYVCEHKPEHITVLGT